MKNWQIIKDNYINESALREGGIDNINSVIDNARSAAKILIANDPSINSIFSPKQYARLRKVAITHPTAVIEVLKEDLEWDKILTKKERVIAIQTIINCSHSKDIIEAFKYCNLSNKERHTILKHLIDRVKDRTYLHEFIRNRAVLLNDKDIAQITNQIIKNNDCKTAMFLLRYRYDKLKQEQIDILESIAVVHQLCGGTIIV